MLVKVEGGNIDKALRSLKRKMQREGIYREMKERRHYMKPSEIKARAMASAKKRAAKNDRKRTERDAVRPGS